MLKETYEYIAKHEIQHIMHGFSNQELDQINAIFHYIDVYFQSQAWLDQQVCKRWCHETVLPFVKEQGLTKFI